MALIKCPECCKDVSSESDKCIHCGYPLKKKSTINNKEYDLSNELNLVLNGENIKAIKSIREKTGLGLADGKNVVDYMVEHKSCPLNLTYNIEPKANIPKCPYCSSTKLSKITATKKVAKIAAFGIFGMGDNGKTWKCDNCGSKF